jgi:hypothetical protein
MKMQLPNESLVNPNTSHLTLVMCGQKVVGFHANLLANLPFDRKTGKHVIGPNCCRLKTVKEVQQELGGSKQQASDLRRNEPLRFIEGRKVS